MTTHRPILQPGHVVTIRRNPRTNVTVDGVPLATGAKR